MFVFSEHYSAVFSKVNTHTLSPSPGRNSASVPMPYTAATAPPERMTGVCSRSSGEKPRSAKSRLRLREPRETGSVMLSRAHTGKRKIFFFRNYYHGNDPWAMKADYPGILPEDVANNIIVPWFDMDALARVWEENKGDIAALIAQPYDHGNFYDNVCSTKEKWQAVRKFCDEHGIVLIFDDVRTGFRLDLAGSDHYYGIKADIICFCKALANGYNMSASCGQEFLRAAASSLSFTGSYWMSAVPFAACITTINKMKKLDTPRLFREKGEKFTSALRAAGAKHGFDLVVSGEPALFYLRIANDDSLMLHQEWVAECVSRGLFLASHHNHFINAALCDADIALAADDAFAVVAARHPDALKDIR